MFYSALDFARNMALAATFLWLGPAAARSTPPEAAGGEGNDAQQQTSGQEHAAAEETAPQQTDSSQQTDSGPQGAENQPGSGQQPLDSAIQNQQPAFYVHAELLGSGGQYQEGDSLRLRVTAEADAFLYVLYQQADGKVYQIFPNRGQPDNRVAGGRTIQVPGPDDLFRWLIGPPFGKEIVKVIASKTKLEKLSDPALHSARFNPVDRQAIHGTVRALAGRDRASWAEVDLVVRTYRRDTTPGAPGARRFGVFFGVSEFMYNELSQEVFDGDWQYNLNACDHDATNMAKFLHEQGGLTDQRLFVNAQATRENLHRAITEWLPSVSRPGDTVFVYFASHAGQIKDDNGDERKTDGMDEFILPHDFIDLAVLRLLLDKVTKKQWTLTDAQRTQLQRLAPLLQKARSDEQRQQILARSTGVSDDTFGRWLQRLAGRQVVVIFDTCHSGGFATDEGPGRPRQPSRSFDFLDSEVARLKDIGAKDNALLMAARSYESSLELGGDEEAFGLFTHTLISTLAALHGPVSLQQGYETCRAAMAQFFAAVNKKRTEAGKEPLEPHEPYMKNYCQRPVVLKP